MIRCLTGLFCAKQATACNNALYLPFLPCLTPGKGRRRFPLGLQRRVPTRLTRLLMLFSQVFEWQVRVASGGEKHVSHFAEQINRILTATIKRLRDK
jgi:hypothetical protein